MLAEMLSQKGRKGDDDVAHLTTGEVVIPAEVMAAVPGLAEMVAQAFQTMGADISQYTVGGGDDSVNPETGMKEFGWDGWGGDGPDERQEDRYQDQGTGIGADSGGDGDGGSYYNQEPNRGPVPGWSPQQNSPRNIVGNEPSEIGGGHVGAFGFSPARYNNPMSGDTHYGVGFNPGRAIGSIAGSLLGGPLGGLAGGYAGGKMARTRFSIPGYGIGQQTQQQGPRNEGGDDNLILARRLMGQ